MSSRIFKHLGDFQGEQYPKFIVGILISAGFDNKLSLKQIDEDFVKSIEEYIDKNRRLIKNTPYEKINNSDEKFKFSIGHRLLIEKIPEIISKLESLLHDFPNWCLVKRFIQCFFVFDFLFSEHFKCKIVVIVHFV